MSVAIAPISRQIWDMKYRLKAADGAVLDGTVEDSWRRVAKALAVPEKDPAGWAERFYEALEDFAFLPAGRILAGAGSDRKVTLFNCFVMGAIDDDMSGIFEALKQAALTMQQGGGIGHDFSTLRPKGAPVHGVGADASGPISFMRVWDAMCRTIMSAGHRRGAMMATLACDHPDIEAFIDAKREPGELRMFNLSVLVTDAFMDAVRRDAPWDLTFAGTTYRTLAARALWDKIMRATYAYAEPGVVFIDRVNQRNNLAYCEEIHATNPCGEQPLPPYGACLLGSINLSRLVIEPFTDRAVLDLERLESLVAVAVRMLDNAIDVSGYPLPEQADEARAKRRIGLGITGLGDALIMCGARYGNANAVALTEQWMARFRRAAYRASSDLAAEKGAFPLYDRKAFLAGETVSDLEPELREAIAANGMRNGLVTSIAPTGTISLMADNVSSGIEPVYAFSYRRNVALPEGGTQTTEVVDHAYRLYREAIGEDAPLGPAFVDAQSLTPADHLVMQATVQRFIDSSISKTINCPESIAFDDFKSIYTRAYELGCKGCTTYRPNAVTGAVLETDEQAAARAASENQTELALDDPLSVHPEDPFDAGRVIYMTQPLDRPEELPGTTYKLRWPESEYALYITVNDIVRDGRRRPFEIFINSKNMEHYAWTMGLMRMISAVFRRGGDVSFVVDELKAVFDPRGGQWMGGTYVPSLLAAIGDVIEKHMIAIGFLQRPAAGGGARRAAVGENIMAGSETAMPAKGCPRCGRRALIRQEDCDSCTECGYSKCD
ncbi:MAG: adenosylcobalamin-dependent ribonucleoside-diphosphate reductase [Alphaproteobacteria bacterium]